MSEWDASPSQGSPPVVNFALSPANSSIFRGNKLIISRSQLFFLSDSLLMKLSLIRDNCVLRTVIATNHIVTLLE